MKKYVNGQYMELTAEEIAAMKAETVKAQMQERRRPLTTDEVYAMVVKQSVNTLDVDDNTALRMMEFYPTWEELCAKGYTADKEGFKFSYGGKLYKTAQANVGFASHWVPDVGTESMYTRIDETHSGTEDDPIPYEGNMALTAGLYYVQDYVVYRCTRDTGSPVYHALSELVGLYVEAAT